MIMRKLSYFNAMSILGAVTLIAFTLLLSACGGGDAPAAAATEQPAATGGRDVMRDTEEVPLSLDAPFGLPVDGEMHALVRVTNPTRVYQRPGTPNDAVEIVTGFAKTVYGWANHLVHNVAPEDNVYSHSPMWVRFEGYDGATKYENHSDCSGFVTLLIQHVYGFTSDNIKTWLGATKPTSARYHDAIVAGKHFTRITQIADVARNQIIAIKYLDDTSSGTGHMMIVKNAPVLRTATSPVVAGTTQYEVEIVDSTASPHGNGDTRRDADGTERTGAGIGKIRLYTDSTGKITGYTWSLSSGSDHYTPDLRSLVIGRLTVNKDTY